MSTNRDTKGETVSEKQYRDKIATIKKQQGTDETARSKARAAAAKYRADAAKEGQKVTPRTTPTMARQYLRTAQGLEQKAAVEDKKAADLSTKLGWSASDLASAEENRLFAVEGERVDLI